VIAESKKLSVIVVTFNSLPVLSACLTNLRTALKDIDHELILIDNASAQEPLSSAREVFPECISIMNSSNIGFAAACNRGAEAASGELLLFVNPDVLCDADSILNLQREYAQREKVGVLGARMRFADGSFQATCRNFPTISNLLFSRGSFLGRLFGHSQGYTLPDYAETTPVPAVAGTMMLIERQLFRLIGGFDRSFFMFMEDTDLCLRLSRSGFGNYFVPAAGGTHAWGQGSSAGRLRRNWYHHISVWKYFLKHVPNGFSIIWLPLLLTVNFILTALFMRNAVHRSAGV
jgi:hypothetical protein